MPNQSTSLPECPATFQPFNPHGPVAVYHRNLPHWRQPGATYFVTFRQADSIPQSVLAEWLDLKSRWLLANGIDPDWAKSDPDRFNAAYERIPSGIRKAFERQQSRLLHDELDQAHGSCVLRYESPQQEVRKSLAHFHGERMWLGDFIIMPNHVHCLVQPFAAWELEDLLGSIKRWTSRLISTWLITRPDDFQPSGPEHERERFWQQESYDCIVRDAQELLWFRRYIADNSVQSHVPSGQFVYAAADWLDRYASRPKL